MQRFSWIVFSGKERRALEARKGAEKFLLKAGRREIGIRDFRDGFFPYLGADIKQYFEELKGKISPDVIFTHYREDLHQDHRLISELTWNTFRRHLILEYEIVKYDGDLGRPNFFVMLNERVCKKKIAFLMGAFKTQKEKSWFTADAFMSVMRLRGIESGEPEGYAEAFHVRKLVC